MLKSAYLFTFLLAITTFVPREVKSLYVYKFEQKRAIQNTESVQIVVNSPKTHVNISFDPPIQLEADKVYKLALVNLETLHNASNINVDRTNNYFKYSLNGGISWSKISIPEGSYDLHEINTAIRREMRQKGYHDSVIDKHYVTISTDPNTLKPVLVLVHNCLIDFRPSRSLAKVLGFENRVYSSEEFVNVDITGLNINIDIVSGSYVNGALQNTIYSFLPDVAPGADRIVETPSNLVYLPVTLKDTISNMEISITDQTGRTLDPPGVGLFARFHMIQA